MHALQRSACTVRSAASGPSLVPCLQKGRMLAAQAESAQMVDDMIQFVRTACQARLFVQKESKYDSFSSKAMHKSTVHDSCCDVGCS